MENLNYLDISRILLNGLKCHVLKLQQHIFTIIERKMFKKQREKQSFHFISLNTQLL